MLRARGASAAHATSKTAFSSEATIRDELPAAISAPARTPAVAITRPRRAGPLSVAITLPRCGRPRSGGVGCLAWPGSVASRRQWPQPPHAGTRVDIAAARSPPGPRALLAPTEANNRKHVTVSAWPSGHWAGWVGTRSSLALFDTGSQLRQRNSYRHEHRCTNCPQRKSSLRQVVLFASRASPKLFVVPPPRRWRLA